MKCPNDGFTLAMGNTEAHTGYGCANCNGAWLPFSYIASIRFQREFSPDHFKSKLQASTRTTSERQCPAGCGALDECEVNKVTLDYCPSCNGVWFDSGELKSTLAKFPLNKQSSNDGKLLVGETVLEILVALFH